MVINDTKGCIWYDSAEFRVLTGPNTWQRVRNC